MFNVILPALGKDLALSSVQLGLVGSVFIATNALLVPVAGFLGDALSRKRIVVVSLFAWSLATLCTGSEADCSALSLYAAWHGRGEAFFFPSAVAMLSAEHASTRARALSLLQTSVYAGLIASGWIGGAIAARWGWRAVFWIFGALGLALSVCRWRFASGTSAASPGRNASHDQRKPASDPVHPYGALRRARLQRDDFRQRRLSGLDAELSCTSVFICLSPRPGLPACSSIMLFAFLGVLLGGAVSDRLAPARPQIRLEIQGIRACSPARLFFYLLGSGHRRWRSSMAALAGFGFFRGLYDSNTYPAFYSVIPPRFHSAASGLLISFAFLVGSIAPVALGKAKEAIGLAQGLSALSLVYVLGALLAFVGRLETFCYRFSGSIGLRHKHYVTSIYSFFLRFESSSLPRRCRLA